MFNEVMEITKGVFIVVVWVSYLLGVCSMAFFIGAKKVSKDGE